MNHIPLHGLNKQQTGNHKYFGIVVGKLHNHNVLARYLSIVSFFCFSITVLVVLTQCKSTPKGRINDTVIGNDTTLVTGKDSTTNEKSSIVTKKDTVGTISFLLPSPDEILSEIFGDKLTFNPKLVNPKGSANKYINTKKMALNLGIYITDFAYLNLNDNKSSALDYFKVIRDMSQKLNIYGLFNEKTLTRLENNLTKKDSLNVISKEIYYNMLSILESSKRNNVYALIACGALVESLYLSTMIVTNYSDYQIVAQRIFEQKYVLTNFYDFASQYSNDPDVKSILEQVDNLKNILQGAGTKTTEKKIKKTGKNQIEIKGGDDIIVTEKSFKNFKENVIKTRRDIINASN